MSQPRASDSASRISGYARLLRDWARLAAMQLRITYLRLWGHRIHPSVRISFSAFLDRTYPQGIEIGEHTLIARGAVVLSHDYVRGMHAQTRIGKQCLIGVNAVICPGVSIGNHVVIGAGAVVVSDIPSRSSAAGNPAKVLRQIDTSPYGHIVVEAP